MFNNSTKMMSFLTLMMSTMMVISSENWLSMWMGLEINMMSFIPLMESPNNYNSSQSKMMYFLIQSMSSIMFLFTILINPMMTININNTEQIAVIMLTISMAMKMGMAPLHMWFTNIMVKMKWEYCLMLMTWQKIAPITIMTNINMNNMIINIMAITSAMIGAIGGINQTSMKKIMAFSSINHMAWMIMCMKYDNEMWMKYLMIYMIIIMMMTWLFKKNSINYINQMNMNLKSNTEKITIMITFLSLGGLPPFIGFLPKWIVIQSMINTNSTFTLMILMFSSMITLFYYMRMMSSIMMSNSMMNKWNMNPTNMKNLSIMMNMINMSLPLTLIMNM